MLKYRCSRYLSYCRNSAVWSFQEKSIMAFHKEWLLALGSESTIRNRILWLRSELIYCYLMQQDILWFYVPMNNIMIAHELYSMTDLLYHVFDLFFSIMSFSLHVIVDVSTATKLHHQIDSLFIAKVWVKLYNIGMVKKSLDFNLLNQLIYKFLLIFKDFLTNFLQGAYEICLFVGTYVNRTKLTFLQIFYDLKIKL